MLGGNRERESPLEGPRTLFLYILALCAREKIIAHRNKSVNKRQGNRPNQDAITLQQEVIYDVG